VVFLNIKSFCIKWVKTGRVLQRVAGWTIQQTERRSKYFYACLRCVKLMAVEARDGRYLKLLEPTAFIFDKNRRSGLDV
jgi:hypothetical protein